MRIYLDDCAYSKRLKRELEAVGHQVQTPFGAGIPGQPDDVHLRYVVGCSRWGEVRRGQDARCLYSGRSQWGVCRLCRLGEIGFATWRA